MVARQNKTRQVCQVYCSTNVPLCQVPFSVVHGSRKVGHREFIHGLRCHSFWNDSRVVIASRVFLRRSTATSTRGGIVISAANDIQLQATVLGGVLLPRNHQRLRAFRPLSPISWSEPPCHLPGSPSSDETNPVEPPRHTHSMPDLHLTIPEHLCYIIHQKPPTVGLPLHGRHS